MCRQAQRPRMLSVIIPVYNEPNTWRDLLVRVQAVDLDGLKRQIILVDDGSTDGTAGRLEQFARQLPAGQDDIKVLFHEHNRGKGAALRSGFAAADGDILIVQDADMEYDPRDHRRVIEPIRAGRAAVVYGSRFSAGRPAKGYLRNYLANRFLTTLSNFTTGQRLTDMETCYKALRQDVLRRICLEQDRFGFEPEITAKVAAMGIRICEVPISYEGRTRREGKKIGFRDGLQAIWCILKYGLFQRQADWPKA